MEIATSIEKQFHSSILRMKSGVSLVLILIANVCFAQQGFSNFSKIDWEVSGIQAPTLDSLSKRLTAPYTTQAQKVRAIFRWITDNIAYKIKPNYPRYAYASRHMMEELDDDTTTEFKSLDQRVAETVFKKKEAVCDGYARLFKTLCNYAGIESEVIIGYARTNMGGPVFKSNHKWNAVKIDSSWRLVDATWASGFISFANDFIRSYDENYFLPAPQNFIKDHYPEDLRWTLLDNPPTLSEFNRMPFRYTGFIKRRIVSYKPSNGIIEASVGDTLVFEMETIETDKKLWITDSSFIDTSDVSVFTQMPRPTNTINGNHVRYEYVVPSDKIQWLYAVYNDEIVLRYRIKVRKENNDKLAAAN